MRTRWTLRGLLRGHNVLHGPCGRVHIVRVDITIIIWRISNWDLAGLHRRRLAGHCS